MFLEALPTGGGFQEEGHEKMSHKNIPSGAITMTQKAMLALSACAVAGVAALQLTRALRNWREKHLRFDFPIEEELFIGWGGGNPRRARRFA